MKKIHRQQLIYKVLSTKNVFLDENFENFLATFCNSPFKSRIPLENTIKHSIPICKSPENFVHGDEGYSFDSDVTSFAVFLNQMFSISLH